MQQFAELSLFRTDLQKSHGFGERERGEADLCFQNRLAIAAQVRRDEDAETPECRQTRQNVRQSDRVRDGGIAERKTCLREAWWRKTSWYRNNGASDEQADFDAKASWTREAIWDRNAEPVGHLQGRHREPGTHLSRRNSVAAATRGVPSARPSPCTRYARRCW